MTIIEKLQNHEQRLNVEIMKLAHDTNDTNNAYVMAYSATKNEWVVWNYNVNNDGLYNGSYHNEIEYANETFEKRCK